MPNAVVLLSGGMDSAVTLAEARRLGFECHALSVDYGQRHSVELQAAAAVVGQVGAASHRVVALDLRAIGGSALTAEIAVPRHRAVADLASDIPVTYVPARNTVLLSLALGWAEIREAFDIFIGANRIDYSGYPDCRPEFLLAFEQLANVATRSAVAGEGRFRIQAPLLHMSKADIVRRGLALRVDLSLTRTCYDPDTAGAGCGVCDACALRLTGFRDAGVEDRAPYRAR